MIQYIVSLLSGRHIVRKEHGLGYPESNIIIIGALGSSSLVFSQFSIASVRKTPAA